MLRTLIRLLVFLCALHASICYSQTDKHGDSVDAKAQDARSAIVTGDYAKAEQIINAIIIQPSSADWLFYPSSLFVAALVHGNDLDFGAFLDKWVEADHSATSHFIRAYYLHANAWSFRGNGPSKDVSEENTRLFVNYIQKAARDVEAAIKLNPDIPNAHLLRLELAREEGDPRLAEIYFTDSTTRYPAYYDLFVERLYQLTPKWGGSVLQMLNFTAYYTENPSKTSSLPFLSIELYAHLAVDKHINCSGEQGEKKESCEQSAETFLSDIHMQEKMRHALAPYAHSAPFAVNLILMNKFCCGGIPELDLKRLLDLASDVLGPDNYAVNYGYGLYYATAVSYKDAIAYYEKAAGEIQTAEFPDAPAKNAVLADMLERISLLYPGQVDRPKALEYLNRAIALNPKKYSYWLSRCQTYFNGQKWQNVIEDCTASIALRDSAQGRYLRGLSYQVLKDDAHAVTDLEAALHFPAFDEYKNKAFPELRNIYNRQKNYAALVELYNNNPFVYDESLNSPPFLSGSYADRCDAYMHLGQNDKALADCDKALELYPASFQALQDKKKIMESTGKPSIAQ